MFDFLIVTMVVYVLSSTGFLIHITRKEENMIKVVEEKPVPRAQVTCRSCGSVLEYGNGDLYKNYHTQVGINTVLQEYYFTCPVCGCQVDVHWITRKEE